VGFFNFFFFLNLLIGRKKFYCKNKLLVITKIVCVVFFLQVNSLEREKKKIWGRENISSMINGEEREGAEAK
jgi:hypothetical protein